MWCILTLLCMRIRDAAVLPLQQLMEQASLLLLFGSRLQVNIEDVTVLRHPNGALQELGCGARWAARGAMRQHNASRCPLQCMYS